MKLVAKCDGCKNRVKISAFMVENRIELARKKGWNFEVRCEKCGQRNTVHVDDVKAVNDLTVPLVGIFSLFLAVFITIWLWNWGFISVVSFSIPILLSVTTRKNQSIRINQFNQLYYDSKRLRNS